MLPALLLAAPVLSAGSARAGEAAGSDVRLGREVVPLLAIAVGPLKAVPIPGLSVPGRVITTEGNPGLAGTAAAITPPILAAGKTYFGQPCPFAKLDLIAVPEYWPHGARADPRNYLNGHATAR